MALFFECIPQFARKVLDTAGIVREAMLRQLFERSFGRALSYRAFPEVKALRRTTFLRQDFGGWVAEGAATIPAKAAASAIVGR